MSTHWKRKAIALMEKHDIEYNADDRPHWEYCNITQITYKVQYIDIDAPVGKRFEKELHALVCHGWDDAYLRLDSYLENGGLESCEDGACGPCYDCGGNE